MAAFIVVPKHHARDTSWEIIDTAAADGRRMRLGHLGDQHQANALATVLNGADKVYRAELARLDEDSPF